MVMRPVYSLQDLTFLLEQEKQAAVGSNGPLFPYYCALLYTLINGLDGHLHQYVRSRWDLMNGLTGNACLLMTLEDVSRQPTSAEFRAEDVYAIARKLGASVDALPCMIFFTDPETTNDTYLLKLKDVFPDYRQLTDDDLTTFFRRLAAAIDDCHAQSPTDQHLTCLRDRINGLWPTTAVTATEPTTVQAINAVVLETRARDLNSRLSGTSAIDRVSLLDTLDRRFSLEELKDVCFRLDVSYDDLPGTALREKARALIEYLQRRDALASLLRLGLQIRPDIRWESLVAI
ncbi:MAG: hypothetical protein U0822_18995 [Anaerolineae bacterium]